MAIKTKNGTIYFLGERNVLTGEISEYVKIGKTDYDRPASERITDHQTGNPRVIYDHKSFLVTAIDTVETHLHHAFAEQRIQGEWFVLDKKTLKKAIAEGERIAALLEEHREALEYLEENKEALSTEPKRKATKKELAMLKEAIEAGETLNRLEAQQACLEWELKAAMGSAMGIQGIIKVSEVHRSPTFDEDTLQEEHPEIYVQFLEEKPRLKGTFSLVTKERSKAKLEPDLVAKRKDFQGRTVDELDGLTKVEAKHTKAHKALHIEYLKSLGDISNAAIAKELAHLRIKIACGAAQGIEEVCKWNRERVTSESFDKATFQQQHPGLFENYIVPAAPPGMRVSIALSRPYLLPG